MASPFRSSSPTRRTRAALTIMLDDTLTETIEVLRKELAEAKTAKERNLLRTRLSAAQRHYQGWADYVGQACPRVPRATEKPKRKTSTRKA